MSADKSSNNIGINDNFIKSILNEITFSNIVFCSVVSVGITLLIYGILYHFYLYETDFIPIKALIVEATCDRIIVNRTRDEYYCLMTIEYKVDGKTISNTLQTHGSNIYYVGTELSIYVNRNNPVDMYIPFVSQKLLVLLLIFFGIVTIIVASGIAFLRV